MEKHIVDVMRTGEHKNNLAGGRQAWYDVDSNTVVIHNPSDPDMGTVFRPKTFKEYFDDLD